MNYELRIHSVSFFQFSFSRSLCYSIIPACNGTMITTLFFSLVIDEWRKKTRWSSFFMPANFFKKTSLSRNILLKITLQRNNENQHASLDSSLIQQRMVGSVKNIFMLPALSYYDFSLRLSDNHLLSSNFFFGISLTLQTLCNRVAAAKWTSTTRKTLVWTYTTKTS